MVAPGTGAVPSVTTPEMTRDWGTMFSPEVVELFVAAKDSALGTIINPANNIDAQKILSIAFLCIVALIFNVNNNFVGVSSVELNNTAKLRKYSPKSKQNREKKRGFRDFLKIILFESGGGGKVMAGRSQGGGVRARLRRRRVGWRGRAPSVRL
jgi:hypothetical protein